MELILGTAQLGMNYGVNNLDGKPSISEAFSILDKAFHGGIRILDTALSYGDSERIIGEYMYYTNNHFKVATKLPKLSYCDNIDDEVQMYINKSLDNLRVKMIDYYFFHNFHDFKNNIEIMNILKMNQKRGKVLNIGVSLYDVEELDFILNKGNEFIDVVQIPFNIFDLRWMENGLLERTKEKGIKIFVRSVYLQGLLFLNRISLDKIHPKAYFYVNKLSEFADKLNIDIDELAMHFVKLHSEIDYVLVGCETVEQINRNIKKIYTDCTDKHALIKKFALNNYINIEKEIIDPRLWGN